MQFNVSHNFWYVVFSSVFICVIFKFFVHFTQGPHSGARYSVFMCLYFQKFLTCSFPIELHWDQKRHMVCLHVFISMLFIGYPFYAFSISYHRSGKSTTFVSCGLAYSTEYDGFQLHLLCCKRQSFIYFLNCWDNLCCRQWY